MNSVECGVSKCVLVWVLVLGLGLAGVGPGRGLDAPEGLLRLCKEEVSLVEIELPP